MAPVACRVRAHREGEEGVGWMGRCLRTCNTGGRGSRLVTLHAIRCHPHLLHSLVRVVARIEIWEDENGRPARNLAWQLDFDGCNSRINGCGTCGGAVGRSKSREECLYVGAGTLVCSLPVCPTYCSCPIADNRVLLYRVLYRESVICEVQITARHHLLAARQRT
jgi:hypothetical protein